MQEHNLILSKSALIRRRGDTILMANQIATALLWGVAVLFFGAFQPVNAAEILGRSTSLTASKGRITLTLGFSRVAPFKVFTLDNPRRLMINLGDTDLSGMPAGLAENTPEISALRFGLFQPGQARIVLDLALPMRVESALVGRGAFNDPLITLQLVPSSAAEFAAASPPRAGSLWQPTQLAATVAGVAGLPLVAIDAGHGGLDMGAQKPGIAEKDIALQMAKVLRDTLLADGRFRVLLTRDQDVFIPLGERVEIARRAGANAFISLHVDVVTLGRARGTTVFSLSTADADQQAVTIATLENRADLVAGISVKGEDDQITQVLLQLAYRQTEALSNRFADVMAETLWFQNDTEIKSRRMAGGFRVLRAPDIPSVLVELGFMSDAADLENLQDPVWQSDMAATLRDGLGIWLAAEVDMRGLLRN